MSNIDILKFLKTIPKLFIYLTTSCNLNCKHCYLGNRLKQKIAFHQNAVINILDLFAQLNGKKEVTFLGGEPILYPGINNILKHAKKNGYYVRLDTNGFYDNRLLRKIDLDNIDEVSISLDGASSTTHDKIRAIGSYELTLGNIRYLKKVGKRVRVITTVMKPNLHEIPEIVELLNNMEVDLLNFHLLSINGNAREHPELWVSPKEWLSLITKIWEVSDLKIRFPLAYLPKSLVKKNIDDDFLSCEIPELRRLSFFPDGKVYCCSIVFDTNLNVGTYDFGKKIIKMRKNSEFYRIKDKKSCIAKDFMAQQEEFTSICRFKKVQNDNKRYENLILKIKEILECRETA